MAYIFSDSFDFYSNSSTALTTEYSYGGWSSSGSQSGATSSVTRFGTGKSFYSGYYYGSTITKTGLDPSTATVFVNFSFRANTITGGTDGLMAITLTDTGVDQCTISCLENGSIVLRRGGVAGTVVATYANAFTAGVWNNFQCKVKIDSSTGTFDVRKNGSGSSDYSATGLNNKGGSNAYMDGLVVAIVGSTNNYLDDLYIFDDNAFSAPSDWTGDIRAYAKTANADTAQKDFTPQGSVSNYLNVGKLAPNITTYNYADVVGYKDVFEMNNLPVSPTSIVGVVMKTVMAKSDTGVRDGEALIVSGVTESTGVYATLSTSFVGYISNWDVDPDTGAAWTASGVNSLKIGYKVAA